MTRVVAEDAFVEVDAVTLSNAELSERDAERLPAFRFVEELLLDRSTLSDEGVAGLSRLKHLRRLSLRRCGISDKGLAAILQHGPALERLHLTGCSITDDSVDLLGEQNSLQEVYLRWTLITDEGAERLQKLLPDCDVVYRPRAGTPASRRASW